MEGSGAREEEGRKGMEGSGAGEGRKGCAI